VQFFPDSLIARSSAYQTLLPPHGRPSIRNHPIVPPPTHRRCEGGLMSTTRPARRTHVLACWNREEPWLV